MTRDADHQRQQRLSVALAEMVDAIGILDRLDAPGDIGSHLDLAIARLERELGRQNRPAAWLDISCTPLAADSRASDHRDWPRR